VKDFHIFWSQGEIRRPGGSEFLHLPRVDRKDVARCASGGIDGLEFEKPRVDPALRRAGMAERRHPTDGETGRGADEGGVGLAERLAGERGGFRRGDLIAACGQKEKAAIAVSAPENDGFRDLVDVATVGGAVFLCRFFLFFWA